MSDILEETVNAALAEEQGTPPEPVETPAAEPEQGLLAGKYQTPEELERGYVELKSVLDRQGQELGELRQTVQQQQQYQPEPQAPVTQETVDWIDEQSFRDPQGTTMWALQNDQTGALFERALENWYDTDPRAAARFERSLEMQAMQNQIIQNLTPAIQPLQEMRQQNEFNAATQQIIERYPDFLSLGDALYNEAQETPEIAAVLQNGGLDAKVKVLEKLYLQAKGRQAIAQLTASQQIADSATAARQAAQVATPGGVTPANMQETPQERWLREVFDPAAQHYYGPDA